MILLLLQSYLGIIFFVPLQSKCKKLIFSFYKHVREGLVIRYKDTDRQRAVLFDNKNISFYICIHDTISFDSPVLRARKKKKKREISQV